MEMITKILLADSSEEFRLLLRHTLEDTGEFQIVGDTGDGEAAWELIQQTQPDIVVMDVILPGLDGVSLLQRMPLPRKNRQQKRPPPRRMPPRPAPSAVLRSRTMHCSATSAARSCKYSQNSAGAVSCWGTAPLYVKNVREIGRKSRKMRLNPCKRAKAAVQLKSSF